ncbi:unnamed protein product, partial [marine sediment metagenome]
MSRMRNIAGLVLVGVVICLLSATPGQADVVPWPWGTQELTYNGYYGWDPQIHNGQITWSGGSPGSRRGIFY